MLTQRQLFLRHNAQTSPSPLLLEIEKAEGLYLFDKDGKRYYDLISGIGVSNVGHCHPDVVEAVQNQASKYMHLMVYGEYVQSPQVQFAKAICDTLPSNLDCVYFVNSGAEAVEGAMKLAKRYTHRSEIIAFRNSYHGSTQGALSVMGNEFYKQAYRPLLPAIKFIDLNDFEGLSQISNQTACVLMETIQGEAGVRLPNEAYMKALRARCDQEGALLILDEIQTGFGRTGKMFGFEHYGIVPDILTIAKGMGGGMPIGAFVASSAVMRALSDNPILGHISTFAGHPVSCAAGLATLQVLQKENWIAEVETKSKRFIQKLKHHKIKEIRAKGLMIAVEFEDFDTNKRIIDACINEGVILDWFLHCENSMRIAPPLSISEKEVDEACDIILGCIEKA